MAKYKRTVRGGRLVASVLYTRPEAGDSERVRAAKSRATTKARAALNLKQTRQNLEFTMAENFRPSDLFVTLTFDKAHNPKDRKEVIAAFRKFIRALRKHRRARGEDVKYIYTVEGKHGDKRLHIHLVLNATAEDDLEVIKSLWVYGEQVDIDTIGEYGTESTGYAARSRYMTKERQDGNLPVGAKSWTGSRNLKKPKVEHGFVNDNEQLLPPVGCYVLERREETNEFGSLFYIKYLLPEPRKRSRRKGKRKHGKE